jgi:hypothetical protein
MEDDERKQYEADVKRNQKALDELFSEFMWMCFWFVLEDIRRDPLTYVMLALSLMAECSLQAIMCRSLSPFLFDMLSVLWVLVLLLGLLSELITSPTKN